MAADFLDASTFATGAAATVNVVQLIITFIVVIGVIGGIFFFIIRNLAFKHTVVIRSLVNNRVIIKQVKARELTDKKGVSWWRLRGIRQEEKRLMPVPDSRCIDINFKGQKWVEVYELPSGGYISIYDKANVGLIPDDINTIATSKELEDKELIKEQNEDGLLRDELINQWKIKVTNRWVKEHEYDKAFKAFGSLDRQAIVNNIKDAQERKNKGIMEQLPQMIAIGSMVFFAVCLLIFAPDWFEGKQAVAGEYKQLATMQQENLLLLRDIKLGIQTIDTKTSQLEGRVDQIDDEGVTKPPN